MGNNKKTVRCSFCSKLGHNRISCEKLKESINQNREQHGSNHPDVKKYDDHMDIYRLKSKINAKSKRFCKYCSRQSHNIRTCVERREDISKLKKKNNDWRKLTLKLLKEKGIGLGCVLTSEQSDFFGTRLGSGVSSTGRGDKWILTTICWEKISWLPSDDKVFKLINMNNSAISTGLSITQMLETRETTHWTWQVVSRVEELSPPEEWIQINDEDFSLLCVILFDEVCKSKRLYEVYSSRITNNKRAKSPCLMETLEPTNKEEKE